MDQEISSIALRSQDVLNPLRSFGEVKALYLFGSVLEGRNDEWSDIDLAAFLSEAEEWDLQKRAEVVAAVQRAAGDDLDIHIFSTKALECADPATFSGYIIRHGKLLYKA